MALPVILVNATGGSDSAASGAGPATALTGSAASFSSDVVTLDGSPDLSGVLADGSHVLYLVTSTGVRFFKITAKDDGADTVTVTPSPAGTASGLTWAIGGKRASIGSSSSRLLFDNASAAGDAMPGWIIEMESGHAETGLSSTIVMRRAGDTTSGPIIFRGAFGAGTKPSLTWSSDVALVQMNAAYQQVRDFAVKTSVSATTSSLGVTMNAERQVCERMTIGSTGFAGRRGIYMQANFHLVKNNEVVNYDLTGIESPGNFSGQIVTGNLVRDGSFSQGAITIADSLQGVLVHNLVYGVTGGIGITFGVPGSSFRGPSVVAYNTIYDCSSDGMRFTANTAANLLPYHIHSNLLVGNGGYGLNFSGGVSAIAIAAAGIIIENNNTYGNTSGAYNPSGIGSNDPGVDPDFVDAGAGDFTPQEASLEGTAFPESVP